MFLKNQSYTTRGLIIGGFIGGLIDVVGIIILTIFLLKGIPSQPGSVSDIELMLFIIAVGVIIGSHIILVMCSGIGYVIGWICEKIKHN